MGSYVYDIVGFHKKIGILPRKYPVQVNWNDRFSVRSDTADHFTAVWSHHRKRPRGALRRKEILMRHGGLCAVPGCSRDARHIHHIVFRSRGGSDDPANCIALCAAHHLHGIHRGHLTVSGRAGERLVWNVRTGEAIPLEIWITEGDDRVRRAG